VKYVNLGRSGLLVSQLCLGAWHLPGSGQPDKFGIETVDVEEFERIVRKAYDRGINFFDTADVYHGRMDTADVDHVGNSERLLGKILKGYERESLVLSTKVRGMMASWPNGEGLSRKHMMWQIRQSLQRLQVDYIDLYQLHWEDQGTPKIETLRTLNNLIEAGEVRYIGESNFNAAGIAEFMELAERLGLEGFVSMQEPYSLLERELEAEKFPCAKKYGTSILAYSPLGQGVLTGKYLKGIEKGSRASYSPEVQRLYLNPQTNDSVNILAEVAREKGVTLGQLALSWIMHKQTQFGITIIPILGITSPSHLDDDLGALDVSLRADDLKRLEEIFSHA
jgi:1-deoxyxylulose-5-phosphate synthase